MDIRELRYILEIATQQNMTRAAGHLYISQPALSKILKKIEGELGVPLFSRDGTTMVPTEAGKILARWGKKILEDFDTLHQELSELKQMERGRVIFGVPPVVSVLDFPYIIGLFHKAFPKINVQIREAGARSLETMVLDGAVDVAISMRPVLEEGLNELLLIRDQIACIVPCTHIFATKKSITLEDLSTVPINTFPEDFAVHQYLLSKFSAAKLPIHINITSPTSEFLIQVSQMLGQICVLPAPIANHYGISKMVVIPFEPSLPWELCIIFKKNSFVNDAAQALISHIQSQILLPPIDML